MSRYNHYIFALFLCLFVSVLMGCGEKTLPGMPKRYPASLSVVQDEKPLANAHVLLINIDPNINWSAGGVTDKDGVVQLRTLGQFDGIPEGTYKVGIEKIELPDIEIPIEVPYGNKVAMEQYNRLVKQYDDNTFIVVDPKFGIEKSTLEITISRNNPRVTVDVSPAIRIKVPPRPKG